MADKKSKPVSAQARNGEEIVVDLVGGDAPGLLVFIPGDFSKPASLAESAGGKMKMLVSTENWLAFKGLHKEWDLVGGVHFGYSKPRKKKS
jgi:hypothetical protein